MKRRDFGAICIIAAVAGCASIQPGGASDVNYSELVQYTQAAIAALAAVADGLVAAGKLSASDVAKVEADAKAAVSVLSNSVDPADPHAAAQDALTALQAMLNIVPETAVPPDVSVAVQLAITVLTAFLALDPATASQVLVSQSRLSVRLPR